MLQAQVLLAQKVPGYMGKKFNLLYKFSPWYSNKSGLNKDVFGFHLEHRHSLEANYVTGLGTQIGLSVTGFAMGEWYYDDLVKQSFHTRIRGAALNFNLRGFPFRNRGQLAPLGKFFGIRLSLIRYGIWDYQGEYKNLGEPSTLFSHITPGFFVEYGNNYIVKDQLMLMWGFEFGIVPDMFSNDLFRIRAGTFFALTANLGIGWVGF